MSVRIGILINGTKQQHTISKSTVLRLLEVPLRVDVNPFEVPTDAQACTDREILPRVEKCGRCMITGHSSSARYEERAKLTKIAPRCSYIPHMPIPYKEVHGVDNTKQECAQDESERGDIANSQLGGQWDKKQSTPIADSTGSSG
jgi:hypothetical protein